MILMEISLKVCRPASLGAKAFSLHGRAAQAGINDEVKQPPGEELPAAVPRFKRIRSISLLRPRLDPYKDRPLLGDSINSYRESGWLGGLVRLLCR